MPFTKEIFFKDKYVLDGRRYDPSKNKSLFGQCSDGCFSIILSRTADDTSAIAEADEYMNRKFQSAQAGEYLAATLRFNQRIVKHYPKQVKI